VIGQTLVAIAQPFIYNAPAKVSANWFPPEQRTAITMIGANASVFGCLLGFLIPGFFIKPNYKPENHYSPDQIEDYKTQMFQLLLFQAICVVVTWVLMLVTFRDKSEYVKQLEQRELDASNLEEQETLTFVQ